MKLFIIFQYILTKEEVIVKTKIWVRANIEYLKEMKGKNCENSTSSVLLVVIVIILLSFVLTTTYTGNISSKNSEMFVSLFLEMCLCH